MIIRWYWVFVVMLLLATPPAVNGQDVDALIKIADTHFDNQSYFKAAGLYLKALETASSNMKATYRVAECYRNISNYHSAEYYYELALKAEDRYPAARYYFAQTQKFNGKYEEALNNFQTFIDNVEAGNYARLKAASATKFSEQARIEREGCLLALKELSKPIQENKFQLLGEPVNTVFMDNAPHIYHHDSTIVITSARSESKGGNFDNKLGESLTDLFRFERKNGKWINSPSSDRFDRAVNSKFHDAAGVFAYDFKSFYYTHCDDQSKCKIYVTKIIGGKWVESVPLNTNINANRSNSQHPSLTTNGDTLFFVSDRNGGQGDWDIWMSIAPSENSWGPPQNLGSHINTPFRETSPFYDSKERTLFFSSGGHKGHGGLDIFMSEEIFDPTADLYNMGLPYNSSRDDMFFSLGERIGFLASNREGGLGKFDIYSFEIESDEEIIAEILNFKEIAGTSSLFSTDFEFDNKDIEKIEEIISHHVAARLHGVKMSLTSKELAFFNNLSEADKARIERIVNTRLKTINSTDIIAVRHEDEFFYQELNSQYKYHVDKMVKLYMEDYELEPSVDIAEEDIDFYERLNSNSKGKVDRYIALKLDEYENLDFNDSFYTSLDPSEQNIVDDISATYLKNKTDLSDLELPSQDLEFLNGLSEDDRELAEMSIVNHVAAISSSPEYEIGDGEQIFYQNLSGTEKTSLDHIANAFIESTVDNIESHLDPQDLEVYKNLSPTQQTSFDKVLAKRIQNFVKADKYTLDVLDERDLQRLTELKLTGDVNIQSILDDHEIADSSPLKTMALEDQDQFVRLLSNASHLVMMNTSSKIKDAALSVEKNQGVEQLLTEKKPQLPNSLTSDQQSYYSSLSSNEGNLFDDLLVQQLTHYVESNPEILKPDYLNDSQQSSKLESQLSNDFEIDKIVSGNGRLIATVSSMSPEQKSLMAGSLTSAAKFMITNHKDRLLALTGINNNSPDFIAKLNNNPAPKLSSPIASTTQVSNPNSNTVTPNTDSQSNTSYTASSNGANSSGLQTEILSTGKEVSHLPIKSGERPVAEIVETSRSNYTSTLSNTQQVTFGNLTLEEKQFMDEAISKTISTYVSENSNIIELLSSNEEQDLEMVEAKLASDLSITNLSASSIPTPQSLTNRTPGFRTEFSDLIANLAQSVISKNSSELTALAAKNNPRNISLSASQTEIISTSSDQVVEDEKHPVDLELQNNTTTNSNTTIAQSTPIRPKSGSYNDFISQELKSLEYSFKGNNRESYNQLTPAQKALFEDILPQRIARVYKVDPDIYNQIKSHDDIALQDALSKVASHADVNTIKYSDRQNTRSELDKLDDLEKDMFSRLLASSMRTIIANQGGEIKSIFDKSGIPANNTMNSQLSVNSIDEASVNGNQPVPTKINIGNRQSAGITEDDYNYYYNLDISKRNIIDKVVALRIVNEHAIKDQHNLGDDKNYLDGLPVNERRSIKRLARFLDGDNMNDIKVNIVQEDLNYYDNISNKKKDDINRLIVGSVFNFTDEHNIYGVKGEDQRILGTLDAREKELFRSLHNIRSQTHNVFGNRLDLDKTIIESQNIIGEVKSFDNQQFKNLNVNGSLFTIDGGKPLANFPISLVDRNGNVVVSTLTKNDGVFSFKNIEPKGNYTIQSNDAQLTARAKDKYFIKSLSVTGNNENILTTKYDEFFLHDGQVTQSVQNSLKDISNLILANPINAVYIKIIDEDYEAAKKISLGLIQNLKTFGVPSTSIKIKRELPHQSDNTFEGFFKNKIELYVESNKRIAPNSYYSFLVRKDTNIEALSKGLKVPEEVILQENNLTSSVISRNSIIRVWRPLSDPDMSLLVNVSEFNYQEYTVSNGESVITIADKLRLPEELIMEVNNLTVPVLDPGQVIHIYVRR